MTKDMNRHFSLGALLKFTAPTVAMMIFTSLYNVVDGFFVSNFIGKTVLAAVNLVWPLIMIFSSVGLMMGAGASALIAKTRGEGDDDLANKYFTMCVIFTVILGILLGVVGQIVMEPLITLLGADGILYYETIVYGRLVMAALPFFALQMAFQILFSTAGKPNLGLVIIIVAGLVNVILDAVFIIGFGWGTTGVAIATAIGQFCGGIIPLFYFSQKNSSLLKFVPTGLKARPIGKACVNGSSELVSNISMSVVATLYNFQLLSYAGENGVAAYSVISYTAMVFSAIFLGYSLGSAPLMSYQYGADNKIEMHSIFSKSIRFIATCSIVMFAAAEVFAPALAYVFVGYDAELLQMTIHAYRIFAFVFLLMGIPVYASALFTSLNNGLVSALIAFLRTLLFEASAVMLLPIILGIDGIWLSVSVAELCAGILAIVFMLVLRKRYQY